MISEIVPLIKEYQYVVDKNISYGGKRRVEHPIIVSNSLFSFEDSGFFHDTIWCSFSLLSFLARLYSCLDHMREVFGDAVPDDILMEAVLKNEFDVEKALSMVLEQDKMQNLKVNSEAAIPTGKIAKGMLLLVLLVVL